MRSRVGQLDEKRGVALARGENDDDRCPGKFSKKIRERCRIRAMAFVAGMRPSTRIGASAKEPRS